MSAQIKKSMLASISISSIDISEDVISNGNTTKFLYP